jgi:hypothetical protein
MPQDVWKYGQHLENFPSKQSQNYRFPPPPQSHGIAPTNDNSDSHDVTEHATGLLGSAENGQGKAAVIVNLKAWGVLLNGAAVLSRSSGDF